MASKLLFALVSGALFALGLVISGMTQVSKVIGFLNVGGIFSPARRCLALVGVWSATVLGQRWLRCCLEARML